MNTDHPTADFLLAEIAKGKTLYIQTATHITKVDQACVDRFNQAGRQPVLANGSRTKKLLVAKGELYVVLDKYNHKLELV